MPVLTEIGRSWRGPGATMRAKLAVARESQAAVYLLGGALCLYLAQTPGLARAAALDPEVPLVPRLVGAAFGLFAAAPPLFYGLAALSHLAARALGGQGTWLGARLALFWSLLAAAPLILAHGIVAGIAGPGPTSNALGAVFGLAFLAHWGLALAEAERSAGKFAPEGAGQP